jgi:Cft2 family RNA processing exonuclease
LQTCSSKSHPRERKKLIDDDMNKHPLTKQEQTLQKKFTNYFASGTCFPVDHIKALIVTHAHIDHIGRIPYLLAAGFKGPIYCTQATAQLLPFMLEDAVKIGLTRDRHLVERLIKKIKQCMIPLPYKGKPLNSRLKSN